MPKFEVDGVEYDWVDSPTFGEAKAMEKVTGLTFVEMETEKTGGQSIDVMQARVWVSMRRVNPDITIDDVDDVDIMKVLSSLGASIDEKEEPSSVPLDEAVEGDETEPSPSSESEPTT